MDQADAGGQPDWLEETWNRRSIQWRVLPQQHGPVLLAGLHSSVNRKSLDHMIIRKQNNNATSSVAKVLPPTDESCLNVTKKP